MKSRKAVELIAKFTQLALEDLGRGDLRDRIAPYRAGYTAQQRRELEQRLVDGELLGVVSTDALELGIDIGSLDAAICVTFPGTVASLRQMWGRAGRRGRGLAVYVAGDDALDQFFCRHPGRVPRPARRGGDPRPVQRADPRRRTCSAPRTRGRSSRPTRSSSAPELELTAERLEAMGALRRRPGGTWVPRDATRFPAGEVSLRSTARDGFTIVDLASGELLGTVDASRAFNTTHQGAVYLHGGRAYEVEALDLDARRALVRPFEGDWYTQAKRETDMHITRLDDRREWLGVTLSFGTVLVTEQVVAYQSRRLADHEVLDLVALDLPSTSFETQALWYELPGAIVSPDLPLDQLLGALHAAEHAQIAVLPLLAMCDRWDIGGLSTNYHPQTGVPTIFIYDGHPGGIGITRRGFLAFDALVDDAHRLIGECPCEKGCPSCVQSPSAATSTSRSRRTGARLLMGRMLAYDAAWRAARSRVVAPGRRAPVTRSTGAGSARSRAAVEAVRGAPDTPRAMRRLPLLACALVLATSAPASAASSGDRRDRRAHDGRQRRLQAADHAAQARARADRARSRRASPSRRPSSREGERGEVRVPHRRARGAGARADRAHAPRRGRARRRGCGWARCAPGAGSCTAGRRAKDQLPPASLRRRAAGHRPHGPRAAPHREGLGPRAARDRGPAASAAAARAAPSTASSRSPGAWSIGGADCALRRRPRRATSTRART